MTSARTITLVPVVYDHTDATDFKKMIPRTMKEGEKAIFLFNDNFIDRNRDTPGANSAAIRLFAASDTIRAVGIPTGWSTESGGFKKCGSDEKKAIFCAFERLNLALHDQPGFDKVYYAADVNDTDNFGFSLFNPCDDIKKYLKKRLQTVPDRFGENNPIKSTKIEATENKLDDVAILDMMLHMPMSQKQKRARLKLEADDDAFQFIDQE